MKLSSVLQGYWLDKELEFSPNTVAQYRYVFQHLSDFFGEDADFAGITSVDVRRFMLWLHNERGVTKRTISDYWISLSSLWTWAERELETTHVIRGKIPQPSYTTKVIEPFTPDEIGRIIKAAEETNEWTTRGGRQVRSKRNTADRDKAIILVLADTGIRATELCDLTIADYDEKRGRFHVRQGKGDKARYVVAGKRTQKAIWRYLAARADAQPLAPLFATRTGKLNRTNLYHMIRRLGEQSGVANAHPHRFRHTFAVTFLRNGGNVKALQELLGHETLEMVMNYVKLADQDLDEAQRRSPIDNWRI